MLRGFHLGVGARRSVLEGGPASAEPLHVNRLGGARRESGAREAVEQGSEGMELGARVGRLCCVPMTLWCHRKSLP